MGNLTVRGVAKAIADKATERSAGKLSVVEEEKEFFEYTCDIIDKFISEIDADGFEVEFDESTKEIPITINFSSFEVGRVDHPIYVAMHRANKIEFNGSDDGESASMTLYLPGIWEDKIE